MNDKERMRAGVEAAMTFAFLEPVTSAVRQIHLRAAAWLDDATDGDDTGEVSPFALALAAAYSGETS